MLESARLAFRTLRGHLFRTFLTMLSVTIGAFSIVVMLSLAQSGQGTLSKAVEEIGGMRLVLWIPPDDASTVTAHDKAVYDRGFTQADLERLAEVPYLEKVTSESQYGTVRVYAQGFVKLYGIIVAFIFELLSSILFNQVCRYINGHLNTLCVPLYSFFYPAPGTAVLCPLLSHNGQSGYYNVL